MSRLSRQTKFCAIAEGLARPFLSKVGYAPNLSFSCSILRSLNVRSWMKNSPARIAKSPAKSRPVRTGLALIVCGFLFIPPEAHARIYVRIGPPAVIAETPPLPGGAGLLCPLIHSVELRARYRCGPQGGLVFAGRHGLASASSGLLSCDAILTLTHNWWRAQQAGAI